MSVMLDVARQYVAKGLSVIPLLPFDKTPDYRVLPQKEVGGRLVWRDANGNETFENIGIPKSSWETYQTRYATDEELKTWFGEGSRNIGIVCGTISGVVVVDLDGPAGISEANTRGLTSPVMATTGRPEGGQHLYFRHPGGTVRNNIKLFPQVDIKADGGYVVAPPSIHSSGITYKWVKTEAAPMPVFSLAIPDQVETRNAPGWIGEKLREMGPGNRDNPITSIVGRLHNDGWLPSDITALLEVVPEVQAHGLEDLQRIIKSITRKPVNKPAGEEELPSESLTEFLAHESRVEWVVPGIIPQAGIGIIAGLQETCKTWIMMDLAIEAARGGLWLGKFPTNKTRVLYIDQERAAPETRRRFKALLAAKALTGSELSGNLTVWNGTTIRINLEASFNAFRKKIGELRPGIIVVDSFSAFHTANENSKQEIQPVLERVKQLRDEFGLSLVFVDHEGKGVFNSETEEVPSACRVSGSQAKIAVPEVVMTVRKKGPNRSAVYVTKSTQVNAADPFVVEVIDAKEDRSAIEVKAVE